jgi:hypothetical protein
MRLAQRIWETFKHSLRKFAAALDPLSKVAQVVAVAIAGFWTYHIHQITGEVDINPELWVSAEAFPYTKDARFLLVHIRQKNVGKVPVWLDENALSVTLKRIPDTLGSGYVDIDKQNPVFEKKGRSGGIHLSPGAEYEDVAEFIVAPGLYHIEAALLLPSHELLNDVAVERVQ